MHTAPDIPLEDRATALRVQVHVLLVAFDDQFILAIPVKVGKLVALPMARAESHMVRCIFSFDQVVINSGPYMPHVNPAKETMPVRIVSLGFPQLHQSHFRRGTSCIDSIMHTQHLLMLVVCLGVTY